MEVLRLFPAVQQFQVKNGALNTDGRLYVYLNGTDDLAECFDADGSRIAQPVILDNNGRAPGLFVDSSKVYRLVVQDRYGNLLFTVRNMVPAGGGAGSPLGKTYDVVSSDGSIVVDEFTEGGTTTFDLSLGIDPDDLKPSCLKASSSPLTSDGQFVFAETAREGTLLSVDIDGKVRMEPAWYHFTATVELAYDGTPVNEGRRVTLWATGSSSVVDFDTSYAHRESIELSGDIHADAANTEFPLGVTGLGNGIRAYLVGFDIHAVTGHGGNNEYRAGEGITIDSSTRTISADFDSVQEKLVAGENISITGNVISAPGLVQVNSDWNATSGVQEILNKPDLDVFATKTEVNAGLAGKQNTIPDLAAIRSGAQAGASAVQPSDLAAVATTGDYNSLNNRPNLTVYATKTEVNTGLATKQDVISDLATIRSGAAAGATAVQPAALDSYATKVELNTGLSGKQDTINDLSEIRSGAAAGSTAVQPADLAAVATTGDYDSLSNKPSIPTQTSDLTNDSDFITSADVPVKDVQVDGASVVNAQGVAEITMPDLTGYATTQDLATGLAGKQDTISDLSTIRSGAAAGATAVQPSEMTSALAGKQDVISDLSTIRSGAAKGATSVQPADLAPYAVASDVESALAGKQDVISDLSDIRSGASAGATAVQPATMNSALAGKQDVISDLTDIRSGAAAGATAVQPADMASALAGKQNVISDLDEIRSGAEAGATAVQPADMDAALADKQDVIQDLSTIRSGAASGSTAVQPSEMASALADKQDVIQDLSTIRSGAAAGATAVQDPDYVHTDENFTSSEKTKLAGIEAGAQVNVNADWNAASGTDAYIANKPSIPAAQVNSDWNASSGVAEILNKPDLGVYATRTELTDGLAGKQDTISDLATIRSGAALGTTSLQPGDLPSVDQSYLSSSTNAQSGTAVAQAISGVDAVPEVTSSDSGKVLVAAYSGGTGSYAWASTPPANPIILDSKSTWSDFHTPYSAGRKDIYYKHSSPYSPVPPPAELYLHLTAVNDVDGSTPDSTYALFEGAWQQDGEEIAVMCIFRYSGSPLLYMTELKVDQSYSSSSIHAQSGFAVAQAISAVNQVPAVTSGDNNKTLVSTYNDGVASYAWAQNTFVATYGTTTYAEIKAAIDAGYNVLCLKTDSTFANSSFAGGIGYLFKYGIRGGNIEFNYFQAFPNPRQANASNQGIAIVHIWKVNYNNTWTASTVVVAPKIVASSPLSVSYSNGDRQVTLSLRIGSTLTTANNAIEVATPLPASTSSDEGKVLTVNDQGTPAWATAQAPISAGDGVEITNNVVSAKVDGTTVTFNASGELQAAAAVTVDQTYNAASTNAQSGTAVAQAVATKEDAFDVGTGLEMDTSGATPTLQVEAPVDIVAGPGIVIDNPDGNTLRVSVAQAEEVVLFETTTPTTGTVAPITLSESIYNFEKIKIVGRLNGDDAVGAPMEWEWYTNDIPVGSRLNCFGVPLNDITNPSLGVYIRNSVEVVSNGTSLTHEHTHSWQLQGNSLMHQSTDVWGQLRYFRVVGIHRIAGGN